MIPFVLVLVGLQLAVPVRCYDSPAAWDAQKIDARALPDTVAYYWPAAWDGDPYVAVGPDGCRSIRRATLWGAYVLAHELEHVRQDTDGRPFDEAEADAVGWRNAPRWQKRLRAWFKPKPPPAIVRIAP